MVRLVLDTDVIVAAFDSPTGASRQVLLEVMDGHAELLLSTPLIMEYEAVLTRTAMKEMIGLQTDEILSVLDELAAICLPVSFDYHWRPAAFDPDDDHVLETAINGGAHIIVSFNLRDMTEAASRFGIAVKRPASVLRRYRS